MAEIHIERAHALGLGQARKIAFQWAEQAERDFGMECAYEEGKASDLVSFSRSGVSGTLAVTKTSFDIQVTLGFLAGAFKSTIEAEIVKNLDGLLQPTAAQPKPAAKPAAKKPPVRKKAA